MNTLNSSVQSPIFSVDAKKKEHSVSMADQSNYELSEKKMSVWYAKLLMWMNPNRMNVSHARNSLSICVLRCHSCHMRQIDGCVALSHCFSYCFHEQKISDKVSVSEFHTINKLRATDTSGIKKNIKIKWFAGRTWLQFEMHLVCWSWIAFLFKWAMMHSNWFGRLLNSIQQQSKSVAWNFASNTRFNADLMWIVCVRMGT